MTSLYNASNLKRGVGAAGGGGRGAVQEVKLGGEQQGPSAGLQKTCLSNGTDKQDTPMFLAQMGQKIPPSAAAGFV